MKTVHKLIKEGKDETILEDLLKSVDVTGGKRAGECWGILGNKYARTPDVMDKLWKKIQKSIIKTDEKSKDGDFCRVFWGFLEMERKTQHASTTWMTGRRTNCDLMGRCRNSKIFKISTLI